MAMSQVTLPSAFAPPAVPPRWRIAFGTRQGKIMGEPTQWSSLAFSQRLAAPSEVTLRCNGKDIALGLVDELATDMWVWLEDTLVFRGRVTGLDDDLSQDDHIVSLRAVDYRGLLDRRVLIEGDRTRFVQVPQADIVWILINQSQAHSGGALGITRGIVPPVRLRDRQYEYGATVAELIDGLSEVIEGFDYEIDPLLRLNVYYPYRGRNAPVVLAYGGSVTALERRSSSSEFANAIRVIGATGTAARTTYTTGIATDPLGRWELSISDPDLKLQTTVNDRSTRFLLDRMARPDTYVITLAPGVWPTLALAIGDWCTLQARCCRLDLTERVRITEISFDADGEGAFTTKLAAIRDPIGGPVQPT